MGGCIYFDPDTKISGHSGLQVLPFKFYWLPDVDGCIHKPIVTVGIVLHKNDNYVG